MTLSTPLSPCPPPQQLAPSLTPPTSLRPPRLPQRSQVPRFRAALLWRRRPQQAATTVAAAVPAVAVEGVVDTGRQQRLVLPQARSLPQRLLPPPPPIPRLAPLGPPVDRRPSIEWRRLHSSARAGVASSTHAAPLQRPLPLPPPQPQPQPLLAPAQVRQRLLVGVLVAATV